MAGPVFDIPGYELVRELGSGGMATVYLAVQRSLDRKVAIKVMRRGLTDENVEKRFLNEGRTMARLPHPNIVGVYDIVQNETINYIAMEFLEGGMLSDRMREGLSLAEAITVIVQIAGALQYAHDNGIVHRDLKPSNIMFRDNNTPVLTDFGIARQQNPESTRLTQTGMMIGTPTYMSPEQATGGDLDGRSDQYALGVLFYEMLTGRPPFEGDTPIQVVLAHLNTPPPPLPQQFAFFQPALDRLLAKDREHRYADLRSFSKELKTLLTSSDTLLHRLRIDPNQTASEQLRALGFSESQIHTGSVRAAVQAQHSGTRKGPRTTGSGPGVRMLDPEDEAPRRPRWLVPAIGGAVLAVALGIGGYVMLRGEPDLDPAIVKILNNSLPVVDRKIAEGKLVAPPGDNAFEELQTILQLAPNFPEAQQRLVQIANTLRQQAEQALASKNFPLAEARIGEALTVAPKDPELMALQKKIADGRAGAERSAEAVALVAKAEEARKAGRVVGEGADNALALLRQAQQIDPDNAAAKQAVAAVADQLLKPAQAALQAGQFDAAEKILRDNEAWLAGEPQWQQLSTAIEQGRDRSLQQARIDGLLATAKRQYDAGRYAEPAGDNVLETLARVAEVDAANAAAAKLRTDSAAKLIAQAQQAEKTGDGALALTRYDQALQAAPDNAAYKTARAALEQKLGQRQTQIAAALNAAREAIQQQRYFSPPGNNAREAIAQALKIDPANATALSLQTQLPTLARDAAEALGAAGKLDEAVKLLEEAQQLYKDNPQIALLKNKLTTERARARAAGEREQHLADLRELLAKRQLNPDSARAIGFAINALLKLDPNDAEARRYREQFVSGIARVIAAADKPETLRALTPVLDQLKAQLGESSVDVQSLLADHKAAGARIEKLERERIAASSGVLVLNAAPWANVESVTDQGSGRRIELPKDASTPLRLTVPAGTYAVTFRHPSASAPVSRVAGVQAQKTQTINAAFPTITSRDYLKRVGYAQ